MHTSKYVIGFDLFGTLFEFKDVPIEERRDYARQISEKEYKPLVLPNSWKDLEPFEDVFEGLSRLRDYGFKCVTCSNAPEALSNHLITKHNLPMEFKSIGEVYKPNPQAYLNVIKQCGVKVENFVMISANKSFGDLEAVVALGGKSYAIRDYKNKPSTIDLAEILYADLA